MKHLILVTVCLLFLTGCNSMTVTTYDPQTQQIQKIEKIEGDALASFIFSLHDKVVFQWASGWVGILEVTPGTAKNPTPHFLAKVANMDEGWVTIPKETGAGLDFEQIGKAIMATRSNLSASPAGFNKTAGEPAKK
jgi:hypothetical protein